MKITLIICIAVVVIALFFILDDLIPTIQKQYYEHLKEFADYDSSIEIENLKLEQEKERTKQSIEKTKLSEMEHEHWREKYKKG